jgi:hypothetical protein
MAAEAVWEVVEEDDFYVLNSDHYSQIAYYLDTRSLVQKLRLVSREMNVGVTE